MMLRNDSLTSESEEQTYKPNTWEAEGRKYQIPGQPE